MHDRTIWNRAFPGFNRDIAFFFLHTALYQAGLFGITDAILNFYFVSLGHETDTIGLLQGIPRLGGLITGVPLGLLADRIGLKRITVWAAVGAVAASILLVAFPSLPLLAFSRFLYGLFYGAAYIAAAPLLMTLTERRYQTHLFAWYNVVGMAGTAMGSALGGILPTWVAALIPAAGGAQTPFAYGASLFSIVVFVAISILPLLKLPERPLPRRALPNTTHEPIPWLRLTWLTSPFLLYGFTAGLTWPFYNLFFRETFHIPDDLVGTILSIGWLGMSAVTLLNPWLDRQFGRVWGVAVMMCVSAVAFIGLGNSQNLPLAVVLFLIAISARNVFTPLFQPLLMENLPASLHNSASSVGYVVWSLGWFSSSYVSGQWQMHEGFDFIMQIVAIGLVLAAAHTVLIFWRYRTPAAINP